MCIQQAHHDRAYIYRQECERGAKISDRIIYADLLDTFSNNPETLMGLLKLFMITSDGNMVCRMMPGM